MLGWSTIVAAATIRFGPDDPRGLFIKPTVGSIANEITLIPVNLHDRSYGTPIVARGSPTFRIESATNRTHETRHWYYFAYAVDPGDYAVLSLRTDAPLGLMTVHNSFCFAHISPVVSIRRGEATLFNVTRDFAGQSFPSWVGVGYAREQARFEQTMADLSEFHPAALNVRPIAFVDLAGSSSVDAEHCEPHGLQVLPLTPSED